MLDKILVDYSMQYIGQATTCGLLILPYPPQGAQWGGGSGVGVGGEQLSGHSYEDSVLFVDIGQLQRGSIGFGEGTGTVFESTGCVVLPPAGVLTGV
jgi:hypothetical protein